jgi:hypothetical protein
MSDVAVFKKIVVRRARFVSPANPVAGTQMTRLNGHAANNCRVSKPHFHVQSTRFDEDDAISRLLVSLSWSCQGA